MRRSLGWLPLAISLVFPVSATPTECDGPCESRITSLLGPANELDIAVNPFNSAHIVATAKDYSLGPTENPEEDCGEVRTWAGIYVSRDSGVTWVETLFPGYPGDTRESAASGYGCLTDPVVAFAPSGELYFVGLAFGGTPDPSLGIVLSPAALVFGASADGGLSWTRSSRIWEDIRATFPDKEMVAVDPSDGTIYVGWNMHSLAVVNAMVSRSLDGGASWLHTTVTGGVLGAFPHPAVGRDGSVFLSLWSKCLDPGATPLPPVSPGNLIGYVRELPCVSLWKSLDKGLSFVPIHVGIADGGNFPHSGTSRNYRVTVVPTLSLGPDATFDDGRVVVAWNSWDSSDQLWKLTVASSSDGGATWSRSHPGLEEGAHQVLPRAAVSKSGVVGVLYYHDGGTEESPGLVHARYVSSRDGGLTWEASIQVSREFDPAPMLNQAGDVFIGDYVGLVFDDEEWALAAWADGRNGRSDAYFARIAP